MFGRRRSAPRNPIVRSLQSSARRTIRRTVLAPGRRYHRRRLIVGGFSLLLVGTAAYKIGQDQALKIQQLTGRPPEDLSQEELEKAMDTLNIEPIELNEADKAAIEAEAEDLPASAIPEMTNTAMQAIVSPPAAQPPAPVNIPAYIIELQQLAGCVMRASSPTTNLKPRKSSC